MKCYTSKSSVRRNIRFIYYKLNQNFTKTKWKYDDKINHVIKEPKGTIGYSFIGPTLLKKALNIFTNGEKYTNEQLDYTTTKLITEHGED